MALSNLALALFVPLVLIAFIAAAIIGIGEILLAVGKEAAVPLALAIATVFLIGAAVISRMGPPSPSGSHH